MMAESTNGGMSGNGTRGRTTQANLAARAGRWSAQHRKAAIWGWLAFTVLAFAIGTGVGVNTLESAKSGVGESGRADRTADDAFPKYAEEMVLVQARTTKANDVNFQR